MKITIFDAIVWIQKKEQQCEPFGVHLGLTGSCLYHGQSEKDFDVIVYPHGNKPFTNDDLTRLIARLGLEVEQFPATNLSYSRSVFICRDPLTNLRIDLIFLS